MVQLSHATSEALRHTDEILKSSREFLSKRASLENVESDKEEVVENEVIEKCEEDVENEVIEC